MKTTEFNLDSTSSAKDGYVYRKGLIFRAGNYQDKHFEMTPEELLAAANEFTPVPLDVEHMPTIFDSKLGSLLAVEPSADGWELYGVAKIPEWLDKLHGDSPFKVSCTWARDTKQLSKLALVKNPRVGDAALMAAFTANELESSSNDEQFKKTVLDFLTWFSTYKQEEGIELCMGSEGPGKHVLQGIHDRCAEAGAICDPSNVEDDEDDKEGAYSPSPMRNKYLNYGKGSEFVSKKESETLQRVHDLVTKQGAKCYPEKDFNKTNNKKEASTMSVLKDLLEKITTLSASLPDSVLETPLAAEPSADADELTRIKAELSATRDQLSQLSADKAKIEEDKANVENELLNSEADKFAEKLIEDKKITPASSEFAKKLFLLGKTSNATFNGEEALLDLIKGLFDSLETHNFTEEVMSDVAVLGAKPVKIDEIEEARKIAED